VIKIPAEKTEYI